MHVERHDMEQPSGNVCPLSSLHGVALFCSLSSLPSRFASLNSDWTSTNIIIMKNIFNID